MNTSGSGVTTTGTKKVDESATFEWFSFALWDVSQTHSFRINAT